MSASDDDELDSILDSALDSFEVKNPSEAVENASCKSAASAPSEKVNEPSAAEALRAFEEALKPLDKNPSGSAERDEQDMQLITDFIKSLESLATGPPEGASAEGEASGEGLTQAGGAPDIEAAIKGLIDNVLSKDVLQEPMQQIRDSLGTWLSEQGDNLAPADRRRHENQHAIVIDICNEYEKGEDSSRVIDLLAKLKDSGALPSAVLRELPDEGLNGDAPTGGPIPGMTGTPAEVEEMLQNCPVQ